MHLGLDALVELALALRDDLGVDVRAEIERDWIDGLIFLLDADREEGFIAVGRLQLPRIKASHRYEADCRRIGGFLDREVRDRVDDPVEVGRAHRVQVGVGRRVHEVDRVRHAVFDRELHGVQVVAERLAERLRVALDPREQLGRICRRRAHVALVKRRARIVRHDVDLFLADDVAAEVLLEVHARCSVMHSVPVWS